MYLMKHKITFYCSCLVTLLLHFSYVFKYLTKLCILNVNLNILLIPFSCATWTFAMSKRDKCPHDLIVIFVIWLSCFVHVSEIIYSFSNFLNAYEVFLKVCAALTWSAHTIVESWLNAKLVDNCIFL